MPRKYLRKKAPTQYSITDVQQAISDVNNGWSYQKASDKNRVPVSVNFNRIKVLGAGRPAELSADVLEKCLVARADMGYPCNKTELKEYLKDVKEETRWYQVMDATIALEIEAIPGPSNAPPMDAPLDLSIKKPLESPQDPLPSIKDIVEIFVRDIVRSTTSDLSTGQRVGQGTRLMHHKHGQVVTSEEVMKRLREAEEKKASNRPSSSKKGPKPKKNK